MRQPSHLENVLRAGFNEKQRREQAPTAAPGSYRGAKAYMEPKVETDADHWEVDVHVSTVTCPNNGSGMAWTETIKMHINQDHKQWAYQASVSDKVKQQLNIVLSKILDTELYNPKYVRMIEGPWEFRDFDATAYDIGKLTPPYMKVERGSLVWMDENFRNSFMTSLYNLAYMKQPIHILFADHDETGYRNKLGGHYKFTKLDPTRSWAEYNFENPQS